MYEQIQFHNLSLTKKIISAFVIIILYLILLNINIILSILLLFIINTFTYEKIITVPINLIINCINANKIIGVLKFLI